MKQSKKQILFAALSVIFLLAACAPAQAPTPGSNEVANLVATSVALTLASQDLDTAEAAPPPATETPLPTATLVLLDTPTAVPPLNTPTPLALPTTVSGGGSSGGTTSKPDYACDIVRRRPFDNTVFQPKDTFDIKWTIVNTGRRTMVAGLDLKFNLGTELTDITRVELPELEPGEQYAIEFDGVAPAKEGTYVMTYVVEGQLCYPYVAIKVEK